MGTLRKLVRAFASAVLFIILVFFEDGNLSSATRFTSQEIVGSVENATQYSPDLGSMQELRDNFQNWLAHVNQTSDFDDRHDPWVSSNTFQPRTTLVVAQDGSGNFQSVQEAVNSVPMSNSERVLIHIRAGLYWEKVRIRKTQHFITIEGEIDNRSGSYDLLTCIAYNSTAADLGSNGLPLKTFESATFATNARNFIARNLMFKNTAPVPIPGEEGGQAVALRVSGDRSAFYGCKFYGNQDTLYDHEGRHFFQDCYAEGTVDVVFGNGRSLYQNFHLNALPTGGSPGYITAQKASSILDTGFSFVSSKITGYGSTYLGRAWGNDSRVVFANTFMDKVVVSAGWDDWGIPNRKLSVFYAEFNCTGPGANTSGRAHWSQQLTYEQVMPFLSISYVNGKKWLQNPQAIEGAESWGPGLGPHNNINATSGSRPYDVNGNGSAHEDVGQLQVTQAKQPYQL